MRMLKTALIAAAVLGTAAVTAAPASARTFVSVGIGGPAYAPVVPAYGYGYAPGYYPGYYAPRPVFYGGGWYGRPHYYHRGYYGYHHGWRRW